MDPIIINGVSVPRPDRLPLVVGDRVRLRDGRALSVDMTDASSCPFRLGLDWQGGTGWHEADGTKHNTPRLDIMEIITPKPDYPQPQTTPQPGEVWTMEVEVVERDTDPRHAKVKRVGGNMEWWVDTCNLKSRVRAAAPKVEVRPGMLIRNLRFGESWGVVISAKPLAVSYPGEEACDQCMTSDAEVRWPWEPESAWRRLNP